LNCAIKVYGWGGNTWKLWSTHSACGCWSFIPLSFNKLPYLNSN
jgi:hypothetical protein